jgi:two-component system, cell cycle sensor histidine kinase and response regulator CckA
MQNGSNTRQAAGDLRRDAEARLHDVPPPAPLSLTHDETRSALHELEVYRIELEMQNAELVLSRADLELSLGKYTDLYDFAPICYLTVDSGGSIVAVNLRGATMFGIDRSRLLGRRFESFVAIKERPAFAALLQSAFASRVGKASEFILQLGAKPQLFVQVEALAVDETECRIALMDVTERKLLEARLFHTQKLESLGILAGGIAHDFNNILMAIFGNADLALLHLEPGSPALENLRGIQQAATRAADLTKQMLAYSGKGRFIVETLDLNELIEKMVLLLKISISKNAAVALNLLRPLPSVLADATQLHQVVMNLVINASEAIEQDGGSIRLSTGCLDCDRGYLAAHGLDRYLREGRYVYLEVADTGCGMSRDTVAKLFDPFFTTKFTGRGLGMAAVLGIVKGHHGAITVESEPGKGSSFKVLLPATDTPVVLPERSCVTDTWQGSGVVLLVDDEAAVRETCAEMLQALGLTPITACDGQQAIETFKGRRDLSLVILDLTMPHLDGHQVLQELRRLDPEVKVIMSSGFNEQEVSQHCTGKPVAGFIQKPYTLAGLRAAIKAAAEPVQVP